MNKLETGIDRKPVPRDRGERRSDTPAALLFRFPFPGPWGEELAQASQELANDMANEDGLIWKIWLEDRETAQAGGIYLFEDAAAANRYREKHEQRLAAMGIGRVMVNAFSVNTGLSVLTMARAALGESSASEIPSMAAITMRP